MLLNLFAEFMAFSGDIWVLNKIAELANRCGISPTVANVEMTLNFTENDDSYYYSLGRPDSGQAKDEKEAKAVEKFSALLGFGNEVFVEFPNLEAVEKAVDHALSLAPRARTR